MLSDSRHSARVMPKCEFFLSNLLSMRGCSSEVYTLVFYLAIINKCVTSLSLSVGTTVQVYEMAK